ncbi:helix-turn-helix transcriptional regulator [Candidatus Liberibacter asiaticus]|uniref:Bacteriophage repressor protein C1 n=1 Tax=Candidatus Liberibacter asiaticus str. gxpsy TaxID=1174529 RepID=A0ABM5NFN5_LIBAS|nr:helix-turn-helix transcriptional regulator [Candidatus Liberibacter asiaticus]AGH16681.1 bacteriophage repressor protein C1 [Candidatus Liberibacter asiaticus str. gxpsy]BAP26202.1 bacteriophage repressor protein C1 [Candidatus Liberibacter asiaticus str. Ishi-1]
MTSFSHKKIWEAIDRMAERHNLTPSGLARKAGLDPTSFNKSKRFGIEGRNRWPSTESIFKILAATNETICQLLDLPFSDGRTTEKKEKEIPLLYFPPSGSGGFFDSGVFPTGNKWNTVGVPEIRSPHNGIYAIQTQDTRHKTQDTRHKTQDTSMLPLYRKGDILILNSAIQVNCGDRLLIKPRTGDIVAKVLISRRGRSIDLMSLNCCYPVDTVEMSDIEWIARILWASQ